MDPAPAATNADPPRPRRRWYVVASLIAAGGVLSAAALVLLLPFGGNLGQPMTPGQPIAVDVPDAGKMVWARESAGQVPDLRCTLSSLPGTEESRRSRQNLITTVMGPENLTLRVGSERWRGLMMVRATPPGRFTVTCMVAGAGAVPPISIGDPPRFYDTRAQALTRLAAASLACLGLLAGIVIAVVGAVRRRRV